MKTMNEQYVEVPLSLLHHMADEACLVLAFLSDGRVWVGDEWDIDELVELCDGDEDEEVSIGSGPVKQVQDRLAVVYQGRDDR